MKIDQIVNVSIRRETQTKTIRDLQTSLIIDSKAPFSSDYKEYTDIDELIKDNYQPNDFGFIAVQRMFQQTPRPKKVIVAKTSTPVAIDYVKEVSDIISKVSNWTFLMTDAATDEDKLKIAAYAETQDITYVCSDTNPATRTESTTNLLNRIEQLGYQQTIVLHRKDTTEKCPEAGYVGRHSVDVLGSNLWGYKEIVGLTPDEFSSTEIGHLNRKNAQYYTRVGEDKVVAGQMNTAGGEKIHVILGILWLKVRIGEALWALLRDNERILYTNDGVQMFVTTLYAVLQEAVKNNILTNDDRITITAPNANNLIPQQRATGILKDLAFRARLAGAIIFVDGVVGTVYA